MALDMTKLRCSTRGVRTKGEPPAAADYIIVGGGSSGATVARRLADSGADVLLIEAGGPNENALVRMPGMMGLMHNVPRLRRTVTWQPSSAPQSAAAGRRISQMHGRGLGGGSAVNGMIWARGHRRNYDDWAADGCAGWSFDDVLPYFKKLERFEDGSSEFRGGDGPIGVSRVRDVSDITESFLDAVADTASTKRIDDYNGVDQEGAALTQHNIWHGRRQTVSRGYLVNAPSTLRVVTGARVGKVLIEHGRATGVEVIESRSRSTVIRARQEVVLSAGAFGSAQLLMLSGVGPAGPLRDVGVPVELDLPVGQQLHDHAMLPMVHNVVAAPVVTPGRYLSGLAREVLRPDSTRFGRSFFDGIAHVRSHGAGDLPDIQLFATPVTARGDDPSLQCVHPDVDGPGFTVFVVLLYPKSTGTVRLASTDPLTALDIDPCYLDESADLDTVVAGIELVREAMSQPAISAQVRAELSPGERTTSVRDLRNDVRRRISSVYHPTGTCRMGVDERAVVDPQLRVRGIDGLRVVDASVIPSIPGGNTNAPSIMIAERAADLMVARA